MFVMYGDPLVEIWQCSFYRSMILDVSERLEFEIGRYS